MIRRQVRPGIYVNEEGYILNEDNEPTEKYVPPVSIDLRDKNIVQTYYWFYDLQGRLKQEIKPPGEYHGRPRAYIQEDIEEGDNIISHLRYYLGKKLISYYPYQTGFGWYKNDNNRDQKIRSMVIYLLNGGWEDYRVNMRKKQKSKIKTKRTPVKKVKKIISKKKAIVKKRR